MLYNAVAIDSVPRSSSGRRRPTDIHVNSIGLILENQVFLDGIKVTSDTPHQGLQRSIGLAAAMLPFRDDSLSGCIWPKRGRCRDRESLLLSQVPWEVVP